MTLPSSIKTIEFARERNKAISELVTNMENPIPSHKRSFQTLPKHLRRRAMSYDVRKIPNRMRAGVEKQVEGAAEAKARNKPGGRDANKFRSHGAEQAAHRNEKHEWLETHLWHAKRFHMQDLWGYKIPVSATMKQSRSIIRQAAESCVFHDISYHSILSISGPQEQITEYLQSMINPKSKIETSIHVYFSLELHQPGKYPNSSIGPVRCLWTSENNLWMIIHPLLYYEIPTYFTQFSPSLIHGELNIFELVGPRSTEVIQKALPPSPENDPLKISTILALGGPGQVPPGFVFSYVASDPRSVPADYQTPKIDVPPADYMQHIIPELGDSILYTQRQIDLPTDDEFNRERAKLLFPKAEGPSGSIPVLLLQNRTGYSASWIVILPFGIGRSAWVKIVQQGARAYGLYDQHHIDLEAGYLTFPDDRPDTNEGLKFITAEQINALTANEKRPKGKRLDLNFYQLPPDFVLAPVADPLAYVYVKIEMANRGTPSRFSTIYVAEETDYSQERNTEIKGERNPIGMVLNGNSSLLAGKGQGFGIMTAIDFLSAVNSPCKSQGTHEKEGAVLVKEQSSQYYHLAWVSLHPNTYA